MNEDNVSDHADIIEADYELTDLTGGGYKFILGAMSAPSTGGLWL